MTRAVADEAKIARVAKGKRPQYFPDPAVDKLHAIVMTLVGEVSVLRERLDAVERLLDAGGTLSREAVENYVPDDEADAERRREREAYIERILRVVEMELEEIQGRRDRTSVEEVYASLLADE